jgi:hypothetical protein
MPSQNRKRVHRVRQGECLSSIAAEAGLFWETVWNDSDNAALRQQRSDPNVLLPGDTVVLRPIETKNEAIATEQRHRFCKRGIPVLLRLRLLDEGEPCADTEWTLDIEGRLIHGRTDSDGRLEVSISPTVRSGTLLLRPVGQEREIPIAIGEIDPADTVSGAQGRLRDLGYNVGPIDGDLGPQTRTALKTFQKDHDLEVSGELDSATSDALIQQFGA